MAFQTRYLVMVVLAVVTVALAACGGGDADGGATTGPPTTGPSDDGATTGPPTTGPSTSGPADSTTGTVPGDDLATSTSKPATPVDPSIPDVTVPEGVDPYDVAMVTRAIDDLAERLEVDQMAIGVVGFEEVMWRDGSLGCPQPGMAYTQALVDGMRIVLTHADTPYVYHQGGGAEPFLCENPAGDATTDG